TQQRLEEGTVPEQRLIGEIQLPVAVEVEQLLEEEEVGLPEVAVSHPGAQSLALYLTLAPPAHGRSGAAASGPGAHLLAKINLSERAGQQGRDVLAEILEEVIVAGHERHHLLDEGSDIGPGLGVTHHRRHEAAEDQ